jgi:hypothetical protein
MNQETIDAIKKLEELIFDFPHHGPYVACKLASCEIGEDGSLYDYERFLDDDTYRCFIFPKLVNDGVAGKKYCLTGELVFDFVTGNRPTVTKESFLKYRGPSMFDDLYYLVFVRSRE